MQFKVGDMVAWANPNHRGTMWHGANLAPLGYRILAIDGNILTVETTQGGRANGTVSQFVHVKPRGIKRNLPGWF